MESTAVPRAVITMTRFQLPENEKLLGWGYYTKDDCQLLRKWSPLMRPLITAEGHRSTQWGRVDEVPGDVIMITHWTSQGHLDNFVSSLACETYDQALQRTALGPVKCMRYEFQEYASPYGRDQAVEVCRVFFAPGILNNRRCREDLLHSAGLKYPYGLGISGNSPAFKKCPYHNGGPRKGFSLNVREWQGRCVKEFVFLNYWKSKESESNFKENAQEGIIAAEPEKLCERVKIYPNWASNLIGSGALGWESEHVLLKSAPDSEMLLREWKRLDA